MKRSSKLLGLTLGLLWASVCAAREPTVEEVRKAGDEFNLGRTAFKDEEYATAAEHFEEADGLAPNPQVLLLAIQSRELAGQLERAATLAALAQDLYPDDDRFAETRQLIRRGLRDFGKLRVSCDRPCSILVDSRLVHGAPATKRFIFLADGTYTIRAARGEEVDTKSYTATAGESGSLSFTLQEQTIGGSDTADDQSVDWAEPPAEEPSFDDGEPAPATDSGAEPERKGLSPVVFWVGAGVTVALAGTSTWSGLDTQNNPGPDRVKEECRGLGEDCPLFKEGKSKERRTNVLWGTTAGAGLVTVLIGAIWTEWGGTKIKVRHESVSRRRRTRIASVSPWIDVHDGASIGARGRF